MPGARATWLGAHYSSPGWRKRSYDFRQKHRHCVWCGAPSQVTDHVTPPRNLSEFWSGPYQAMCKSCHSKKTNRFDKPRQHPHTGCDADGMPVDGSEPWAT